MRPSSGSVLRACMTPLERGGVVARAASAPPGGIIVFWSHDSSDADRVEVAQLAHPLPQGGELRWGLAHPPARA